jgi:transcription initiation factor TFIID subunit 7
LFRISSRMLNPSRILPKRTTQQKQPEVTDDIQDWENHVIVRFPPEVAPRVEKILEENAGTSTEQLAITFNPDMRHGTFKLGQKPLAFKVHDLPCIVEVQKTLDKKNLYKVADLSQMIVVSNQEKFDESAEKAEPAEEAMFSKTKKEKSFQWPHGLAPPLKNVRKRRFRKTKKKKYMDAPEVEKELKRLLRSDLEAHSVRWEVVSLEDEKKKANGGGNKKPAVPEQMFAVPSSSANNAREASKSPSSAVLLDNEEDTRDSLSAYFQSADVLGELSSSSSENEDDAN